jgi:hypothetical protein
VGGACRVVMKASPTEEPTEKRDLDALFKEMERQNQPDAFQSIKSVVGNQVPSLPKVDMSKPFRFPAYGFLFVSIMLAISFVGSLTELAGGSPLVSRQERFLQLRSR